MIKDLLNQAATSEQYGFEFVGSVEDYDFYKKSDLEHKRFLVVHEAKELLSAEEYNFQIDMFVPEVLKKDPAFEKNSDFIVLLKIDNLSDFNLYDKEIFLIEEDPYHFKKYVLYYSPEEVRQLENFKFADLSEILLDRCLFKAYKKDPNFPSKYSFAARLYIKVPFLKVPVEEGELKDVSVMLTESLIDKNLHDFDCSLGKLIETNSGDFDEVIKEYLSEKMEVK